MATFTNPTIYDIRPDLLPFLSYHTYCVVTEWVLWTTWWWPTYRAGTCSCILYRVIRNDSWGFNNLSYTIHLREEYFFLFNITTLQVFVTYLTGALYVHPLWFYKYQHENRVRSKLFVACQRWWFQWLFWFVPSVLGYLQEEEKHKPDPWRNPIKEITWGFIWRTRWQFFKTPTIISNNPVYCY